MHPQFVTFATSRQRRPQRLSRGAQLCALLSLVSSQLVLAQSTSPDAAAFTGLQEIVVTATRHEEVLSRVPISVTAFTADSMDVRGIKDFQQVARFTPGVSIDNSGTNNISIRGIASTGGAGTTGVYIVDTPIQMRALAFIPDDTLPKSFDVDRIEVLRGPQGTLFGAGSEGGTVRYLTVQPSLTASSLQAHGEVSSTQSGDPSYELGVAAGTPLIDHTLGVRLSVWYRRDGGWIDHINPSTLETTQKRANYADTYLIRLSGIWAPSERVTVTPSFYYQSHNRNDQDNYWQSYSHPNSDRYVSANPTQRSVPDTFYLPTLKIEADVSSVHLVSNTSYYHRINTDGYEGTLYNLGFYQTLFLGSNPEFPLLLDGSGVHLPSGAVSYRSPASVQNGQQNFAQEIRLQSADMNAALTWTTGVFYGSNRQTYLEQIKDTQLNTLLQAVYPLAGLTSPTSGDYVTDYFSVGYDPAYPQDSYFLKTNAKDEQLAWFGEATYAILDTLKATVGLRYSKTKFSFDTLTGGPQLFGPTATGAGNQSENSVTPKFSLAYQHDVNNLYYATYAKGFRPGGANNPVPAVACAEDFQSFGISAAPETYKSDSVQSYELGTKNNFNNKIKLASSVYYIRWQNIQQTVVPPICQISFISNLGQAIAKGADIQATLAVTDHVVAEFSAGYTDARYSQNSVLSSAQITPIVSAGDAIVGQSHQPSAPFTFSSGLEYHFAIGEHDTFIRADYQYQSRARWPSPTQDPTTQQYDANNYTLSSTSFASMRGGTSFGNLAVTLFVDNLTNTRVVTNYDFTIDPGTGADRLQRAYGFRPRTVGITFTYKR